MEQNIWNIFNVTLETKANYNIFMWCTFTCMSIEAGNIYHKWKKKPWAKRVVNIQANVENTVDRAYVKQWTSQKNSY